MPSAEALASLKNEQTARIVLRDTALYIHIGTIVATLAAEGQLQSPAAVELIRACSVLLAAVMFSIYASNDYYVSKIGTFVATAGKNAGFDEWEAFHKVGLSYRIQKYLRVTIVLVVFVAWTSIQAASALADATSPAWWLAIAAGLLLAIGLAFYVLLNTGQSRTL